MPKIWPKNNFCFAVFFFSQRQFHVFITPLGGSSLFLCSIFLLVNMAQSNLGCPAWGQNEVKFISLEGIHSLNLCATCSTILLTLHVCKELYYCPGQKNWDSRAPAGTGAWSLKHARACSLTCVAVPIFLARVVVPKYCEVLWRCSEIGSLTSLNAPELHAPSVVMGTSFTAPGCTVVFGYSVNT